ncbi:MAG: hypothetical protein WC139_05565 [Candidatus Kapaibacterium sp.]
MDEKDLIKQATIEAIYWWNDSEDFYHKCFSKLDKILENDEYWEFFKKKILKSFLNNYSIRRNIPESDKGFNKYFNELKKTAFISKVKKGDIKVIDEICAVLKCKMDKYLKGKTNKNGKEIKGKNTKSLLSKIAHMINPNDYPIYDNFTKDSLWLRVKKQQNYKLKRKEFDEYLKYKEGILGLIDEFNRNKQFENAYSVLNDYKGTLAYKFFIINERAFKFRVVDKLLWFEGNKRNSDKKGNNFTNDYLYCYKKFLKLMEK